MVLIIAFEGIDGSGVTTHARLATEYVQSLGFKACLWKEPTRGPIGGVIRLMLSEGVGRSGGIKGDMDILALLFAADRLWGLRYGVGSSCGAPDVIIFDRYKYSSLAYQGAFVGIGWVDLLNSRAPEAHAVIFLDVPLEVSLRRISARGSKERMERRDILERVREAYWRVLRYIEKRGVEVYVVKGVYDGRERSVEEVGDDIRKIIRKILDKGLV